MADHSDFLWNSLDSFSGFTPCSDINVNDSTNQDLQEYTVEDHTPENKSIVVIFKNQEIFKELWTLISQRHNGYTSKGDNGDIICCTEMGLKVTLTFYISKLKLHIQGDGCVQWKGNTFEDIMNEICIGNGVQDISQTCPKQRNMSTPIRLVQTSSCPPSKSKYLKRAANRKGKQIQAIEQQLADIQRCLKEQKANQDEVKTLQAQLIQSKEKIHQQDKLINQLRSENKRLQKDICQTTNKLNQSMADKKKADTNLEKTKANLVKANTETFFHEDTIKSLKTNIAKIDKERTSLLNLLSESNYKYDDLKDYLEKATSRFEQCETSNKDESENTSIQSGNAEQEPPTNENNEISEPPTNSNNDSNNKWKRVHQSEPKTKTLLIGSSILKHIDRRGLLEHVDVKTHRGATVQRLLSHIKRMNIHKYSHVVLHVGGNDASQGSCVESIVQDYEELIKYIYNQNSETEIFVSGLTPRRDVDVRPLNIEIQDLAHFYGYVFFDNYSRVNHSNGCLSSDGVHISKYGTSQLLWNFQQELPIIRQRKMSSDQTRNPDRGCYYCGEQGHVSNVCRHEQKVQCWKCGLLGHKSKLCNNSFSMR